MTRFHGSAISITALALLAACGGGEVSTAPILPPSGQTYETFVSTAAVTSTLGGTILRTETSATPLVNAVIEAGGTYRHDTGRIELDLGNYVLIDPDGFGDSDGDGLLELSDGTVTVEVLPGYDGFEYATFFGDGFYSVGSTDFLANGIFGIVTLPGDVPTSSSGTYTGLGSAIVVDAASGDVTEQTATAAVTADFDNITLSVDLVFDDTAVDGVGITVPPAIDRLSVNDMLIWGNQIVTGPGTTIVADYDALAGDPVGTVSNERAEGAFFGFDTVRGIPDEVGGVVLIEGSAGTVAAGFLAD